MHDFYLDVDVVSVLSLYLAVSSDGTENTVATRLSLYFLLTFSTVRLVPSRMSNLQRTSKGNMMFCSGEEVALMSSSFSSATLRRQRGPPK